MSDLSKIVTSMSEQLNKIPSNYYMQKSLEAETLLEKSVYKGFAERFNAAQQNAILVVQILEHDRKDLLSKAESADSVEQKEFFEKAADLYKEELGRIYRGEI